jgi:hypothetical protein
LKVRAPKWNLKNKIKAKTPHGWIVNTISVSTRNKRVTKLILKREELGLKINIIIRDSLKRDQARIWTEINKQVLVLRRKTWIILFLKYMGTIGKNVSKVEIIKRRTIWFLLALIENTLLSLSFV